MSLKALRHIAVHDAQAQPLGDRRFAHAGLADQNRIVLGAAREHLDGAADLLIAADHRVELTGGGVRRQIARETLQGVVAFFGGSAVGGAALAQRFDRGVQRLRRYASALQSARRIGSFRQSDRQKKPLDGYEGVAGLLRDFFGALKSFAVSGASWSPPAPAPLTCGSFASD